MEATFKIGELAKRSGVAIETMRYFELLGLPQEPRPTRGSGRERIPGEPGPGGELGK